MPTLPPPPLVTTVLEALVTALARAGAYNRNDMVAPAAVLWPDEARVGAPPPSPPRGHSAPPHPRHP